MVFLAMGACWASVFGMGNVSVATADENTPQKTIELGEKSQQAFREGALPFLKKHCTDCHSGNQPKADLTLQGFDRAATLIPARKSWDNIVSMVEGGFMPPEGRPQPTLEEREAFLHAVAAVYADADHHAPRDPGRVTVRRLNRTEYNNTIRDLVGVDFNPAEDFPADDIGHGFDNIGDVLTLSPVLMERYLAAAESIVNRAIVPDPPKPSRRHLSARYTEPAGPDVAQGNFRALTNADGANAREAGPVFTRYKVPADGEYIFRTRVYAEPEGEGTLKLAVLAAGEGIAADQVSSEAELSRISGPALGNVPRKIVQVIEVAARDAKQPQNVEVPIPPLGFDRLAVALLTPGDGQATGKLHLEFLSLEGPLDPRPASHRQLLARDENASPAEQTLEVLNRFASRAYRRPATADEVERLAALVAAAEAEGLKWEAAMQLAFQAVLVSPKFLFRLELDDRPEGAEPRPLNEYQLASRLSYFLWSTMPDDELFDLAARDELTANLAKQVRRMLSDPRSLALVDNFALQWLQLKRLETFSPDINRFPQFTEQLRSAMLEETRQFLAEIVQQDRSVLELLNADFTYLNEPLARHYGIVDTLGTLAGQRPVQPGGQRIQGPNFVRVQLADNRRGGLLTQASVLTVTSNPTRTSPVKRGRWLLEQILGSPPPPPPPNVPELVEDEKAQLTGSLRQRMEQHRANPACANCHARMDPLGFAFENYDAIGGFRLKDGEFEIDPSGELLGGESFAGAAELKQVLLGQRDKFARCLTEKMLIYAVGRGLEYYDRAAVETVTRKLAAEDYRFSALVSEIVKSDPFRLRRGNQAAAANQPLPASNP